VDPHQWALELSRYIHLNPVRVKAYPLDKVIRQRNRAGVGSGGTREEFVRRREVLNQHLWSSYPAYIGRASHPSWLECEALWNRTRVGRGHPQEAYRKYVEEALREGLALVKKGVLEGGSMELVRSEMGTEPRAEEEPRPYPVRWFCIEPARRRRSPAPV
jgi:hypothetical protein